MYKNTFLYLDDILCYSNTFEEHLVALREIIEKLRLNGLKLKPSKRSYAYQEIRILGHVLCKPGIKVDPDKLIAIYKMPVPKNVSEVRTFLGMTSYYRKFIKDYALIARPFNYLNKKDHPFVWSSAGQAAFDTLRQRLTEAPILRQFDERLPVKLYCDARGMVLHPFLPRSKMA